MFAFDDDKTLKTWNLWTRESSVENIKKVFGDKVEATTKVDKSILGGFVVKTDDEILDGSIGSQLKNLASVLS